MPELEPRSYFLPRLARDFYQGDAVVLWSMSFVERATGWLNDEFHLRFRELMLHAAAREGLVCPAYCLMPDHLHLVWMGLRTDTDQLNGMAFLRTHLRRLLKGAKLQKQAHDEVLRDEERRRGAFARVCFYVLANPVRAELVRDIAEWPFAGAIVPRYPTLHPVQEKFWAMFWKLYEAMRDPKSGERRLSQDRVAKKANTQQSVAVEVTSSAFSLRSM